MSSWFDTKGLASLAKTALKEAQKQIDKALDIQDDEHGVAAATAELSAAVTATAAAVGEHASAKVTKKLPGGAKSNTAPNTPVSSNVTLEQSVRLLPNSASSAALGGAEQQKATANWGSFTGSFFDNPNAKEMVTTPPKIGATTHNMEPLSNAAGSYNASGSVNKRQSVTSNSDSVELLSPPTSPCSALTSPSEPLKSVSASVEQLTTPTSSELPTPDITDASLPGSIVIIASDEACDDDEEDSMSFNTVMDDTLTLPVTLATSNSHAQQQTKLATAINQSNTGCNLTTSACSSSAGTSKLCLSLEDAHFESQTVHSDSTQSFEDIQMLPESHSSDDKSDLVKISSGPCSSEPNSNDEVETTTSSDIEIISNPNGDSSSTHSISRASPHRLKQLHGQGQTLISTNTTTTSSSSSSTPPALASGIIVCTGTGSNSNTTKKGHFREPSEISILSEDSQSESDRMLLRISELNELLEAREMRLLEFGRQNAELQERNNELQSAVDALRNSTAQLDSAEEYTQRLSALEKKFQASIRERDALRIQLQQLKAELQTKIPRDDLTQVVSENNMIIGELRSEGEKLAKEILQQSNIIKKLRAKEKTADALLKKNKQQIAELSDEVERLKKTLNAKEDVERAQIEAVHKMSAEKRKLFDDSAQQRSLNEDLQQKLDTLQTSFDAVKVELQQRTRQHTDLTRTAEAVQTAQQQKAQAVAENQALLQQLTELREKLRHSEQSLMAREQNLRAENNSLLRRLEASEMRAENLTQEVGLTTIPLMRQLEALQSTLTQRTTNWNKQERQLLDKLEISQTRLNALQNVETTFVEKNDLLNSRCLDLEAKLSEALMQVEKCKIGMHQVELEYNIMEGNLKRQISQLTDDLQTTNAALSAATATTQTLQEQLAAQLQHAKVLSGTESAPPTQQRVLTAAALNSLNEVSAQADREHQQRGAPHSPILSVGRNSLDEAIGGHFDWQDDLDCVSSSGRQAAGSAYGMHISLPYMGHNATTLEHLQALLKQRDGEVNQLQWELSRLQAERGVLNDEISNLTLEMEIIKDKLLTCETLEKNFADLQHQYDALLQMYGEKVERTEELELDLLEVKEAYKAQIDELLAQPQKTT